MEKKKLPIGIDDFAKLRINNFYYVDKTGMLKELLDNWGEINLFTRPRRFGKSLNMSMLRNFFEIGTDKHIFDGLAISKEEKLCETYMGRFPVISVSLKTAEGRDYTIARANLCTVIGNEARRFQFLLDDDCLTEIDKKQYRQLINIGGGGEDTFVMTDSTLMGSIKTLSDLLYKHYKEKVVILIDEYDVPLQKASVSGYYGQMIEIIRGMFNSALKSNDSLFFAVMTGCLRVAKESIFTGLNNPKMYTLLDEACDKQFGFTDDEVRQMLAYYEVSEYYDVTKEWYDGYRIGHVDVYNPWDVLNWCNQLRTSADKEPKSYWVNSSGNVELRNFIQRVGDGVTKAQIERLISGETVQKKIEEQLTYDSIYDNVENMWSLLYATGYLTRSGAADGNIIRLKVPNTEVRCIFRDFVLSLFEKRVVEDGMAASAFCDALKNGNPSEAERLLTALLKETVSVRDTAVKKEFKESFYHGILLGILGFKVNWDVNSNRESGSGFFDISIEIEDEEIGIIIEVKYAEKGRFEAECEDALKQINDNDYAAELKADDMKTILKYGIAFYKKQCRVVLEREEYDSY